MPKMHQPHHAMVASSRHDRADDRRTRIPRAIIGRGREIRATPQAPSSFFEQRLRRRQPVAPLDDLGDLAPAHAAAVEPHPEPAARPDVSRQIEALGLEPRAVERSRRAATSRRRTRCRRRDDRRGSTRTPCRARDRSRGRPGPRARRPASARQMAVTRSRLSLLGMRVVSPEERQSLRCAARTVSDTRTLPE